jgi:hypothetical protein
MFFCLQLCIPIQLISEYVGELLMAKPLGSDVKLLYQMPSYICLFLPAKYLVVGLLMTTGR